MISWMQKHNKYLVWTIWVATIAFIGAGFVGWGSYSFGSTAGNVAKVGNIEISQGKLNQTYSSIYNQYNAAMQGKLDEIKAKELGLVKMAFSRLETKAKIMNFANDLGIVVSEAEVATQLQEIKAFQKEGVFNREIYDGYLRSQRIKAHVFEETLLEDLLVQKAIDLLSVESLAFEEEAVSAGMNVSDKLAYQVLTSSDLSVPKDESKIKAYWEMKKDNFLTDELYELSIVWTDSKDTAVTAEEIKAQYDAQSFNYTDTEGKQLSFVEAEILSTNDAKLKKTKKIAQKAYIAFKKSKIDNSEKLTLAVNDAKLSTEIWTALKAKSIGGIMKPKVVGNSYATIRVDKIIVAKVKSYEKAKEDVSELYMIQAKKEALLSLAETTLKDFKKEDAIISDFVKLEENVNLKELNTEESLQFLQKLFTSVKEKGIISLRDKIVVYNILEQKLFSMEENQSLLVKQTTNKLKQDTFESNLIKMLNIQYPTEVYMKGLIN